MPRHPAALLAGLLLTNAAIAQHVEPLRVLYAGQPDHPRTASFTEFLGNHFKAVDTIDFRRLNASTATDCDVVVLDIPSDLPYDQLRGAELPSNYDRPTVLVGCWPARLAERAKLKIDDG